MENLFVDYLNSMNNVGGNTIAALAESQVLSEYYEKIHIERVLGKYIANLIRSDRHIAFMITGHAGDGKTSVLVQVLVELGLLEKKQPLQEECTYQYQNTSLYTVKDMSELHEEKQFEYFQKAVTAPQHNGSSILISNTGPLLKCFEQLISNDLQAEGKVFDEQEKNKLQNTILGQLDENHDDLITVGNYQVMIINIARVDNVDFAEKALHKILQPELWSGCEACAKKDVCPIYNNVNLVRSNQERVASFITSYYRYLYEHDKRMTIRQMLAHLSYAITGNLTCQGISRKMQMPKFRHLFSNQFFGYRGLDPLEDASQIQGIAYANLMEMDAHSLNCDYQMFVTGDFRNLPSEIRCLALEQYGIFNKRHLNVSETKEDHEKDRFYRRAIRRMYIMFGYDPENVLFDELFGKGFQNYQTLITAPNTRTVRKSVERMILEALYMESTGVAAKRVNEIPLTLRRNDNMYQKVLVISGKIKKDDLQIEVKKGSSRFDDNQDKKVLDLVICGRKRFRLTLPMVVYFEQLAEGAITTTENPTLTHGISKLKTLLRECAENVQTDMIEVMLNKTDRAEYCKMEFSDGDLYFE